MRAKLLFMMAEQIVLNASSNDVRTVRTQTAAIYITNLKDICANHLFITNRVIHTSTEHSIIWQGMMFEQDVIDQCEYLKNRNIAKE
mgnify:FL=1